MAANTEKTPVTQAELARRAGVTRLTVHRALFDRPGVSDATRRRIRALARELGYRVGASAGSRARRYDNVALISTSRARRSALPGTLLEAIIRSLDAQHRHLLQARLDDRKLIDPAYMATFRRAWMCDGLLINYHVAAPEGLAQLIETYRLPAVWLNTPREHDAVYLNDYEAGMRATRALLERGHRRIALFDPGWHGAHERGDVHYSRVDRHSGYVDAMQQAGLAPRRLDEGPDVTPDNIVGHMAGQVTGPDRPTALVANSPTSILTHTLWHSRLDVPGEISAVGLDLYPLVVDEARFTTITAPHHRIGALAVDMIDEKIETGRTLDARVVDLVWHDGFSFGPPPEHTCRD